MLLKTFLIFQFILIFNVMNQPLSYNGAKSFKFSLPKQVKKSFKDKELFYQYRSFITGNKRGINKEIKVQFKELQILHLMTPSGLHFSTLLGIFVFFRRRSKLKWLIYFEAVCCLLIYLFLPGYYSLRRVALLRFLFIINKDFFNFKKEYVFLVFFLYDFLFGTFSLSPISFAFSTLFLGVIFFSKRINYFTLSIYFFIAQAIIISATSGDINLMNIVDSPFLTLIFTLIYPVLFFNGLFIGFFNVSEVILEFYLKLVKTFHQGLSPAFIIELNLFFVAAFFLFNKKTIYLSLSLLTLAFIIN